MEYIAIIKRTGGPSDQMSFFSTAIRRICAIRKRKTTISSCYSIQTNGYKCFSAKNVEKITFFQTTPLLRHRNSQILDLDAPKLVKNAENSKNQQKSKRIEWSGGAILMLGLPAFAFSLGIWQCYRLKWKLDLIDHLHSRLSQTAVDLPLDLSCDSLEPLEYCRVTVTGEFLHNREFIISPRGRFDPAKKQSAAAGSMLSENEMSSHGGHLITPFRLKDSGKVILINRGWLPSFYFDPSTHQKTNPIGVVTFDGIVRKTEKRPQFVGQNIPEQGVWYYRDLEQIAKHHDTEPVWLDAAYETTVPGGPIGGQTNINVRNEHLNYMTTWFTLTLVTLLMWIHKFRK
ncbi:CRE-SFT-1 protein [Caenorhabditis remanei]|uniref:SURF1-like protein n=1 Tax=Caenorhabditis remanei TaxID=31234 RepID=E3NML5_CAERE|nr:CRE-SFT-1 protein [Caenorhabditis remanei]